MNEQNIDKHQVVLRRNVNATIEITWQHAWIDIKNDLQCWVNVSHFL